MFCLDIVVRFLVFVYLIPFDSNVQLSQLKRSYEEKLRGMLPSAMKQVCCAVCVCVLHLLMYTHYSCQV